MGPLHLKVFLIHCIKRQIFPDSKKNDIILYRKPADRFARAVSGEAVSLDTALSDSLVS
jgi:hypothetical protein